MFRVPLPRGWRAAPHAYLNELIFHFSSRFWPFSALNAVLGIAMRGKAPTYVALYDGTWIHPAVVRRSESEANGLTG